jgi:hypothetical protein
MKTQLTILMTLAFAWPAWAGVSVTNIPDADAFVRALAPTLNYGGGGALSISGANPQTGNPTNGAFDTFMRFNTGAMVSNFNSAFGSNNWVITSATLTLTENPNPGNPVFNYGTGAFEIRWIADDNWIEGTGTPMNPQTNGITYSEEPSLLNSNTDVSLGSFNFAGTTPVTCALPLAAAFVNNMEAGGEVGLFMTAIDPTIGFLFYSRSFAGNPKSLPTLVVSAAAPPVITALNVSGADLVLSASNGVAGGTYSVLTSTNIAVPFSQWTPVTTNILVSSGNFSVPIPNAAGAAAPSPQYFILQTQ